MAYNVLIVDDSPAMRRFVRRVLELTRIELDKCLEANNGQEALDLLRLERMDIVLTDINMPLMDGEELLRALNPTARCRRSRCWSYPRIRARAA